MGHTYGRYCHIANLNALPERPVPEAVTHAGRGAINNTVDATLASRALQIHIPDSELRRDLFSASHAEAEVTAWEADYGCRPLQALLTHRPAGHLPDQSNSAATIGRPSATLTAEACWGGINDALDGALTAWAEQVHRLPSRELQRDFLRTRDAEADMTAREAEDRS
mmetsp:Transcript_61844/g.135878  ORF Transcript_61844/g.135878 Transcript_61844/m.135878 type:complete len:167 (-) Transcript_61844:34-534(-)